MKFKTRCQYIPCTWYCGKQIHLLGNFIQKSTKIKSFFFKPQKITSISETRCESNHINKYSLWTDLMIYTPGQQNLKKEPQKITLTCVIHTSQGEGCIGVWKYSEYSDIGALRLLAEYRFYCTFEGKGKNTSWSWFNFFCTKIDQSNSNWLHCRKKELNPQTFETWGKLHSPSF